MSSPLFFVPLGGVGEFGANFSLYGYDDRWLAIDCGMGFADEELPGVDIVVPDPAFAAERRKRLEGIIITHAHEDHVGAIAHLWPYMRCPVYATRFTLEIIRTKLQEKGLLDQVKLQEVAPGSQITLGPFAVDFVSVTHSIPEANLLRISTPAGRVIHTGDWKLDPDPVVGALTDQAKLAALGREGVDVLIGDSTNAMTPGHSVSEAEVQRAMIAEFKKHAQRIAVLCFASNVARLRSIAHAAEACGRHVALVGRSLWRISDVARETGYLDGVPSFVSEEDAGFLPRDKVVLVCTGSQGEARAAMPRIAENTHPHITLEFGDTVIFSSRAIPGNEKAILRMKNRLIAQGIKLVSDREAPLHASGHPAEDELRELYHWLEPKAVIPVHGETAHLHAHAALADDCGVPFTLIPENGAVIQLAPQPIQVTGTAQIGKLAVQGDSLMPAESDVMRLRRKVSAAGSAVVTLVMDKKGRLLASPQISSPGLIARGPQGNGTMADFENAIQVAVENLPVGELRSDAAVEAAAARALRRQAVQAFGKKPVTDVHLVRVQ